jgi:hypothetical protein
MDCVLHTLLLGLHLGRTGGGCCAGILTCSVCTGGRLDNLLLLRGGNGWRGAGSVLNALAGGDYDFMISISIVDPEGCIKLGFPRPLLVAIFTRVVVKGRLALGETDRTLSARTASLNVVPEMTE